MPTGTIILPITSAILPDDSASNKAPAILRVQGTETAPKKHFMVLAFDPAQDEHAWWNFRMPVNFASAPILKLQWYTNDTGSNETCVWGGRLGAITPADTDTPIEHAQAAATTANTDANTTEANRLLETSITLANVDSVAAGDAVFLLVYRDGDNGSDDLTSDALLLNASLEYTTT